MVKITKDTVDQTLRALKELANIDVLVGIPESAGEHPDSGISNAALGYIQENGAPEANIPPRPFLIPGVEAAKSKILSQLKKAAIAASDRNPEEVEKAMMSCGLIAQESVKEAIVDGQFTPLKEATMKARERAGHQADKPLIETGSLLASIRFVTRKKGQN